MRLRRLNGIGKMHRRNGGNDEVCVLWKKQEII